MRTCLLLLLSVLFAAGQGFNGTSRTGTNISTTGWSVIADADSPEGTYAQVDTAGVSNLVMLVTLPTTLAAGTWRVQIKVLDYQRFQSVRFTLGTANSPWVIMQDSDPSAYWLDKGVNLTNSVATNQLSIAFTNTGLTAALNLKMRVFALYWTTNLNEDLDPYGKDLVFNYTLPPTISTAVDNTNNILPASSFEAGLGGWRPIMGNRRDAQSAWLSSSESSNGNWSLTIRETDVTHATPGLIESPYFHVKDDSRWYNVGVSWKGTGYYCRVRAALASPTNYASVVDTNLFLGYTATWRRTNFPVCLTNYPYRMPYVIELSGMSNTWFDSVMVHEGTNPAPFRTMGDLEIGWSNSTVSGVYYTNETAKPAIVAYNTSGGTRTVTIKYEFWNHQNEMVLSGSVSSSLADGGRLISAITLPLNPGWYRAICWSDGVSPQEAVFVHMPDPTAVDTSYLGTHNYGNIWQIQGAVRLGVKWSRAMSPQAAYRWSIFEPTDNVIAVDDHSTTNTTFNGGFILGTVGAETLLPYFGSGINGIDNTAWTNYGSRLVEHYGPLGTTNWEIWNEPDLAGMTVAQYTNLLKAISVQIKAVQPGARIVPAAATTLAYMTNVLFAFGSTLTNYIDGISIHGYPADGDPFGTSSGVMNQAPGYKQYLVDIYGPGTVFNLPIYNTESGMPDWRGSQVNQKYITVGGGIYTYSHQRPYFQGLVEVPNKVVQHVAGYRAYGFSKFFYYDSRVYNNSELIVNDYSSWEPDDGHAPKLAGSAMLNYLAAGTTGAGSLASRSNEVQFFYYENGNNSRCMVWTTNSSHYTFTSTNVMPYDWCLTPKTVTGGTTYTIGRMGAYLYPANGLTSAQFKSALTNSSYAPVADTFAPKVSVFLFPGSTITDTNRVHCRWSVVDEYSLPGKNNQSDLLTRSALIPNTSTISDGDYDAWSTTIDRVFTTTQTNSTLYVQGKDAAGNITTQTRQFGASPAGITLNVSGNANVGTITIQQ